MRFLLATIGALGILAMTMFSFAADKAPAASRTFELRTYYAPAGKMPGLLDRFRNHTVKLFEKHGMTVVGFWVPTDAKEAEQKLVYLMAYPSKAAADKSWDAFRKDPEWIKVKEESEKDGKLVEKVESVYLAPTEFSPLQ
jgi:hypothetical protein